MYQTNVENENSGIQILGRLSMMGFFSTLLCFSLFMTVFTPYPLGLASVLYGRVKGAIATLIGIVTCFVSLKLWGQDFTVFFFYLVSVGISFGISEIIHRDINPMKGIVALGAVITFVVSGFIYLGTVNSSTTIKEELVIEFEKIQPIFEAQKKRMEAAGESQPYEVEALLTQPKLLADYAIENGPSVFLMALFVTLWVNLFLLLKSNRMVKKMSSKKYSEEYLLNFKMPDNAIWFVILFLALSIWGDQVTPWISIVALTCLKTLGVFYFFQGFGIYLAFLDLLKLTGFFRSLMVVTTVFIAGQVLAIIGLADMFVDFKKLMKRKED